MEWQRQKKYIKRGPKFVAILLFIALLLFYQNVPIWGNKDTTEQYFWKDYDQGRVVESAYRSNFDYNLAWQIESSSNAPPHLLFDKNFDLEIEIRYLDYTVGKLIVREASKTITIDKQTGTYQLKFLHENEFKVDTIEIVLKVTNFPNPFSSIEIEVTYLDPVFLEGILPIILFLVLYISSSQLSKYTIKALKRKHLKNFSPEQVETEPWNKLFTKDEKLDKAVKRQEVSKEVEKITEKAEKDKHSDLQSYN